MSSYLALKIGYITKHTHIQKVELKTLYFNFDSPLQKRFLRSISRKRLTIEVSALDELMVLSIHAPLVSYLCALTSPGSNTNWLHSKNPKREIRLIIIMLAILK